MYKSNNLDILPVYKLYVFGSVGAQCHSANFALMHGRSHAMYTVDKLYNVYYTRD